MFHLERVGPTTAGGKDRAMKVQLLKGTEQLGVHNIIRSWYLQFTESYTFVGLKKIDIQHVFTHMLTQSSCKQFKKKSYPFYPFYRNAAYSSSSNKLRFPQKQQGPDVQIDSSNM